MAVDPRGFQDLEVFYVRLWPSKVMIRENSDTLSQTKEEGFVFAEEKRLFTFFLASEEIALFSIFCWFRVGEGCGDDKNSIVLVTCCMQSMYCCDWFSGSPLVDKGQMRAAYCGMSFVICHDKDLYLVNPKNKQPEVRPCNLVYFHLDLVVTQARAKHRPTDDEVNCVCQWPS